MQRRTHLDDHNRDLRRGLDLPAFVYRNDDSRLPVIIKDLSYDGCQIQIREQLVAGEVIVLVHASLGEVTAEVRWTAASRAGLSFACQ